MLGGIHSAGSKLGVAGVFLCFKAFSFLASIVPEASAVRSHVEPGRVMDDMEPGEKC